MSDRERKKIENKILRGSRLAVRRLIERQKKMDGKLVVYRNGKVVILRAREIKLS